MTKERQTTKEQTTLNKQKQTLTVRRRHPSKAAERESVRVLARKIGARAAARRLGISEKTVLSWSHRNKWNLPLRRNIGRPAVRLQVSPTEALLEYKRDGGLTRTDIAKAKAEAAEKLCG